MINVVFFKYICAFTPFFFISSHYFLKQDTILFCKNNCVPSIILFLKYSFFFFNSILLELSCYEIPFLISRGFSKFNHILIYIFMSKQNKLFIFSLIDKTSIKTIELFFRNAKWLEREVSDFYNIFFKNKKDRRNLFVLPIIQQHPFEKKFPVGGFYELFVCLFFKKIKFRRVSYLN